MQGNMRVQDKMKQYKGTKCDGGMRRGKVNRQGEVTKQGDAR